MKVNNIIKNSNYIKHTKYILIVTLIVVIISAIVGLFFNFNYDYDLRKTYGFNIKFSTIVSNDEYKIYEEKVSTILNNNNITDYRFEQLGEGVDCSLFVTISSNDSNILSTIDTVKTQVVTIEKLTTSTYIKADEDTQTIYPVNIWNNVLYSSISIVVFVAIIFGYLWFRIELKTALYSLLISPLNIILTTSLILIFRIPISSYLPFIYVFGIILGYIIYMVIMDRVREQFYLENFSTTTNNNVVYNAVTKNLTLIGFAITLLQLFCLAILIFMPIEIKFLSLALTIAINMAVYNSLLILPSLWAMTYKKDKDKRLIKKLEAIKLKEENKNKKEEEKLVV